MRANSILSSSLFSSSSLHVINYYSYLFYLIVNECTIDLPIEVTSLLPLLHIVFKYLKVSGCILKFVENTIGWICSLFTLTCEYPSE